MQDLNKALGDISSIRMQVARSTDFRGYGPATLAATGLFALAAATAQWRWLPDAQQNLAAYLAIWIATAVVSGCGDRRGDVCADQADAPRDGGRNDPDGGGAVFAVGGRGRIDDLCAGALRAGGGVDAAGSVAGDFQPGSVFIVQVFAKANVCGGRVVSLHRRCSVFRSVMHALFRRGRWAIPYGVGQLLVAGVLL